MLAGAWILWFGVCVTVAVGALLVRGFRGAAGDDLRTVSVAVVMLANHPIAAAATWSAAARHCRYDVSLANEADTPWPGRSLGGGGVDELVPDLAPGGRARASFWFRTDGALVLRSPGAGDVVVEGCVTHGMGGAAAVVRRRDGSIDVERVR